MAAKNTLQFFLGPLLKKFFQDMGRDPNNLEMILIKQKAGQLLKDSNKVINFPQKKSFMEQVETMKRSGDIVDVDDINISDKITEREMFKNSNLNKKRTFKGVEIEDPTFDETLPFANDAEKLAEIKMSNEAYRMEKARGTQPTIEGQMEKINAASKRLSDIMKEREEMYRPKTDAEIKAKFDKQNQESIQRFKDKMKKDEPEDKADGGRMGFRAGKFVLDKIIAKLLGDPKKVKQAADDIFPTGDYKYDAQMAAEALVENNPRIFKNKLYDDLDLDTQMEIYGAVLGPIQKNMSMAIKMKKASRPEKTLAAMKEGKGIDMSDPDIADEFTRFMKETDPQGSKTIEQTVELANFDPKKVKGNAEGGRIGYQNGNQVTPQVDPRMQNSYDYNVRKNNAERTLNQMSRNYDFSGLSTLGLNAKNYDSTPGPMRGIPAVKGIREKMIQDIMNRNQPYSLTPSKPPEPTDLLTGMFESQMLPNMADGSMRSLAEQNAIRDKILSAQEEEQYYLTDPISGKQYKSQQEAIEDLGIITYNQRFAKGGRAGFYTGGMVDVEPNLSDIGHGSDALMARTRLVSPDGQATTSTGLNYLLAEDNDNIRVPYSAGGSGRRAFLKLMATIGGLTAAAKSGIIGLGEGTAKKAVTETVKQSAGNYPPPYFFKLVEKIKFMGDDITKKSATKDREIVKKYKDFEMSEDLGTGEIVIKKRNEGSFYDQDGIVSDEYIVYKPGQADEATKMRTVDEYDEYTVRPDAEGKLRDSEDGLDSIDEILEEVGDPDSITLKKADGGRIGFSGGKLATFLADKTITGSSRRFLEKIFGKGSLDEMLRRDPNMHRGMLEVVEMFRKRDKEGLKMYMQKFLPHMDDETVEAFIRGDAADAAGQGKYGLDNIQGQLIRLGSGRDYAGKIEAMKKLENAKKLDTLDVTEEMIRKPNASGGIQTMLGE